MAQFPLYCAHVVSSASQGPVPAFRMQTYDEYWQDAHTVFWLLGRCNRYLGTNYRRRDFDHCLTVGDDVEINYNDFNLNTVMNMVAWSHFGSTYTRFSDAIDSSFDRLVVQALVYLAEYPELSEYVIRECMRPWLNTIFQQGFILDTCVIEVMLGENIFTQKNDFNIDGFIEMCIYYEGGMCSCWRTAPSPTRSLQLQLLP
jgi:hypothetical protein